MSKCHTSIRLMMSCEKLEADPTICKVVIETLLGKER